MKEGKWIPTHTKKVDTNIHQSDISNELAVNNNNKSYNTDTDNNDIVNITKEDKNNILNNNKYSYNNHATKTGGPNSQDHGVDGKYHLNINDPDYTEDYSNLLEPGVNSDNCF